MNNVLLAKVLKLGILELMVLHMKMVNAAVSYDITGRGHNPMYSSQFSFLSQTFPEVNSFIFRNSFHNYNYFSQKYSYLSIPHKI